MEDKENTKFCMPIRVFREGSREWVGGRQVSRGFWGRLYNKQRSNIQKIQGVKQFHEHRTVSALLWLECSVGVEGGGVWAKYKARKVSESQMLEAYNIPC